MICGRLNWNAKEFNLQGLLEGANLVNYGNKTMLRLDLSNLTFWQNLL